MKRDLLEVLAISLMILGGLGELVLGEPVLGLGVIAFALVLSISSARNSNS